MFMSSFGGVSHDLIFSPQCPGGVQMLEGQQIAGDHLQCYDRRDKDSLFLAVAAV